MAKTGICSFLLVALAPGLAAAEPLAITVTKPFDIRGAESDEAAQARLDAIPGGAELVDDARWDEREAATIKDMLDYSPGVMVQQRDGAEASRLSMRGSGLARAFQGRGVLLMQDGIPINTADGSFDLQELDPWLYRRVEVLRGANALEEGASTLGGAIDFVTPVAEGNTRSLRAEGGSFSTRHGMASAGGREGAVDTYAAISQFDEEGFRAQNQQHSTRAAGNAGWQMSPHWLTRLYVNLTDTHAQLPGALTLKEISTDPEKARPINVSGDYSRNLDIGSVAGKALWEDEGERFSALVYTKYRGLSNPSTVYITSIDRESGVRMQYGQEHGRAQWKLGSNLYYGDTGENRYGNSGGAVGAPVVFRDESALTSEAYGHMDFALLPVLHALAGVQVAYAQRNINELFPGPLRRDGQYYGLSPRVGLRYTVSPELDVFSNFSGSFEPPTLNELSGGNAPGATRLAAQRANTEEVGARGHWRRVQMDVAVYHSFVSNEFLNYRFADGSTATVNAQRSTHSGLELGLGAELGKDTLYRGDRTSMQLSYTLNRFRLAGDPVYGNNIIPGVPEHYLHGKVLYSPLAGWDAGPNVEWVPKAYPVDTANTLNAPGYVLLGFSAGWRAGGWRAYVEGRNLGNVREVATTGVVPNAFGADTSQFYPVEGRAVYAGLRFDW